MPPEFSFEWDSPEEATQLWAADLMHWPNGLSLLSATMDMPAFARGATTAAETLCMPMKGLQFKHVRGYVYNSFEPYSTDPAKMQARMEQMQTQMMKHVPGLYERWRNEYEPEVRSINNETLHGDYRKLGDADLSALLETLVAKREREGELHFLAVFPAGGAVTAFEQVYTQLFGPPKAGEHLQLLQGFANKSTETDTAIWRLAMEARSRPAVLNILRGAEPSRVHTELAANDETRPYHDAVEEFLDKHGWRGNDLDVASTTWKEDPTTAYKLIREYASRDDYNPEDEFKSLVAARQAREKMLTDKLSGDEQRVGLFRMMLGGAQQYLPVQEDHNFWIDQQGVAVQRVPVLDAGRRLVDAHRIGRADDVFFLTYDELQDALRGGSAELSGLVEQRRREAVENRKLTPPAAIGTPPPEAAEDNPMLTKFFGGLPDASADPRVFNGNGASSGKITGTARVILSLDDAERLQSGEILVCKATMPPWTPLFGIASAVVTDHGGILSHTAIVAREYRIPAVIGTKVATSLVRDGQTITVDGDAGTVRLED
ncbi:MAG: PEP-utilizing enzyme [Dehalococcoidia bacterium]